MKPSITGSSVLFKRVLFVLSGATLLTASGCYTKLATDGDHWGYTGPVKQKVVVRETEDTVVIRETRVIHDPQPVMTDTLTYTNTSTGDQDVVVNNYYAPAPPTFGAYDPWTNSYRTWYDDYWYRPGVSISVSFGDPYYDHHHHRPFWWRRHWAHRPYYHAYWNDHYRDWWWYDRYHHHNRWAYYDPYWPYPGSYGCYPPYDPYWPSYGYGYYDHPYYGHHGHGHGGHGYYDNDDDRDRDGRERRRGNVGGEDRGRGSKAEDNTGGNTGSISRDKFTGADRSTAIGVGGTKIGGVPVNTQLPTRDMGTVSTSNSDELQEAERSRRVNDPGSVGNVQISTGEIPASTNSGARSGRVRSTNDVPTSPAQDAPDVYRASGERRSASTHDVRKDESKPNVSSSTPERVTNFPAERTQTNAGRPRSSTSTPGTTKSTSTERESSSSVSTTPSRVKSSSSSSPSKPSSSSSSTPSYSGPRSSSSSSSSGARSSSSSGSSGSSSRGSDSRGSDSKSSDSRSDGGSRGRR